VAHRRNWVAHPLRLHRKGWVAVVLAFSCCRDLLLFFSAHSQNASSRPKAVHFAPQWRDPHLHLHLLLLFVFAFAVASNNPRLQPWVTQVKTSKEGGFQPLGNAFHPENKSQKGGKNKPRKNRQRTTAPLDITTALWPQRPRKKTPRFRQPPSKTPKSKGKLQKSPAPPGEKKLPRSLLRRNRLRQQLLH
jgi:hypothetical protein